MGHLGVELQAVPVARLVRDDGHRRGVRRTHQREAFRKNRDLVAVTHPHVQDPAAVFGQMIADIMKEAILTATANLCVAEFALVRTLDLAAELHGHGLHAVAHTQDRQIATEQNLRRPGRTFNNSGFRPPGEDHPLGGKLGDLFVADIPGADL